jgi:hypothetical protein
MCCISGTSVGCGGGVASLGIDFRPSRSSAADLGTGIGTGLAEEPGRYPARASRRGGHPLRRKVVPAFQGILPEPPHFGWLAEQNHTTQPSSRVETAAQQGIWPSPLQGPRLAGVEPGAFVHQGVRLLPRNFADVARSVNCWAIHNRPKLRDKSVVENLAGVAGLPSAASF